jgi:hypothetical protein
MMHKLLVSGWVRGAGCSVSFWSDVFSELSMSTCFDGLVGCSACGGAPVLVFRCDLACSAELFVRSVLLVCLFCFSGRTIFEHFPGVGRPVVLPLFVLWRSHSLFIGTSCLSGKYPCFFFSLCGPNFGLFGPARVECCGVCRSRIERSRFALHVGASILLPPPPVLSLRHSCRGFCRNWALVADFSSTFYLYLRFFLLRPVILN